MYDIFSNSKIGYLRAHADQVVGTVVNSIVNFNEKNSGSATTTVNSDGSITYSVPANNTERTTRALILIEVTNVNATGTLDITVEDMLYNPSAADNEWDADFCVIPQIIKAGLYAIDLKGFGEQLKLSSKATVETITWGAIAIGFEAEKRPVVQSNVTILTPVYATDRTQPMTSSAITDPTY